MTQTAKPKLSDMSGYGADDVVILERKTYEELLAGLKQALRYIEVLTAYQGAITPPEVETTIKAQTFPAVIEISANSVTPLATFDFNQIRAAIARAEGR